MISRPLRILIGLVAGLALGALAAWAGWRWLDASAVVASAVGALWLDALKMTIVPLVFALLVTGISSAASAAAAGGVAARSLIFFAILLLASGAIGALAAPALLELFPAPQAAAEGLRAAAAGGGAAVPAAADPAEWVAGIIPDNPVAAAASGAMLPLVVFALFFGFAATRIAAEGQARIVGLFQAVADTMLVVVGWVLWAAPAGVFALAYVVGAKTGLAAAGALAHYVLIISGICVLMTLLAYPVAMIAGRTPFARFARASAPAQAVAVSTQSSLASMPAMIQGAEAVMRVPPRIVNVVLPLAVSLFRLTSPAANVAVVIYVAHLHGIPLGLGALAAGALVSAVVSLAVVGVASQVSFFTTLTVICGVMGVPGEILGLLIAVETIPDIFRTAGNVTGDMAAMAVVARRGEGDTEAGPETLATDV